MNIATYIVEEKIHSYQLVEGLPLAWLIQFRSLG